MDTSRDLHSYKQILSRLPLCPYYSSVFVLQLSIQKLESLRLLERGTSCRLESWCL
jgi:hypothetical protein